MDQLALDYYHRLLNKPQHSYTSVYPALVGRTHVQRTQKSFRHEQCLATSQAILGSLDHDTFSGLQPAKTTGFVAWSRTWSKVLFDSLETKQASDCRLDSHRLKLLFSRISGSASLGSKKPKNDTPKRDYGPEFRKSSLEIGINSKYCPMFFPLEKRQWRSTVKDLLM